MAQNPYMQYPPPPQGPPPPHPYYANHQQMQPPPPHWVSHGPPPQHPSHQQPPPPHPAYHPAYGHQPPPPHGPPHPMSGYHQVHPQQPPHAPPPHPMGPNPYMQYPHQPHPHYYTHHQQMQHPPPHQSPYPSAQPYGAPPPHPSHQGPPMAPYSAVSQPHQGGPQGPPPQMSGPPQPHHQQPAPVYSHHPPHPSMHGPPTMQHPHWVHGPHQPGPPHPQQHMMQHPPQQMPPHGVPQPAYYQPQQHPHSLQHQQTSHQPQPPHPQQQQQQQQQQASQQSVLQQSQMQPHPALPPPASPHHPPSRTHTPQHLPPTHTPTRQPPPQSSTPASPSNIPKVERREISFPKNSVEATKPIIPKKRKITSKDVADIEVWRLLMCLRSGLLAESSWAIDVLSILLNDDSTYSYFGLQNTPGLLDAILEHFKCCLNEIYDELVSDTTLKPVVSESKLVVKSEATENGISNNGEKNNNNDKTTNKNSKINGLISGDSLLVIAKKKFGGVDNLATTVNIPNLNDQIVMLQTPKNYTFKTRDGKTVKLKNGVKPKIDDQSNEHIYSPVEYSHWQEGKGEDTSHIQIYFEHKNFQESSKRLTGLSTILRNLSFIPGNDVEMSKHAGLLLVLGRLLVVRRDDIVYNEAETVPNEWHLLNSLREDTLVIISNISSSLDLSPYNDKINLSLLDGLLHWACCSTSYALDPFPAPSMTVSPQRLALESLAKLSIIEGNVDLILATPPWSRIEKLFELLARLLNINEDQTVREFSLVLLSNLTSADSGIARKVALTGSAIPRLITFLETSIAEPETFSTTQDMLRRAAVTLKCLSQLVENHGLFGQHQQRLLNLVMSQRLDPEVVPIIADVIFEISLSD